MAKIKWKDKPEIPISYCKEQRMLYKNKNENCIYKQFERQVGINKRNFVEMVAKKYFEDLGYKVESYYYLVRNRHKREKMSGFRKICEIFGENKIRKLIAEADRIFRSKGKKIAGGDPDLFVYEENNKAGFFVEVKEKDEITENQKILFPLIEKYLCPVHIARVAAES